jgi:trk system potassium uptake protein TrkA
MYIVIAGAGRLGGLLAQRLREDDHQVCIIDKSFSVCERIAEETKNILVINGDASDPDVLTEAKLEKADVVVAATPADEDNIIICNIAKELFNVRRSVARVNDPKHLPLYQYMGVDVPVDSTSIVTRIVEEEASFSDVMNLLSIKKGRLSIVRVDIPKESPIINKKLKDVTLPPNSVLVSIIRGSEIIIPSGSTQILAGDEIIAATLIDKDKELITSLIGKL